MTDAEAIELAKKWLLAKGCTLWMNWDISDNEGRTKAATWYIENLHNFMDFVEGK